MALFQARLQIIKKYFNSLNKLNNKNLSDHLTFCGARSDIANVYKISDIVMNLSSKPEPFGRTIIEAAACGSHVMGWDRGGVKESINAINPIGLVEHGKVDMLAKQIDQVLEGFTTQNLYQNNLQKSFWLMKR